MTISIDSVSLMNASFTSALTWDDVILLDVDKVYVQIEASGAEPKAMPKHVEVVVKRRPPNAPTPSGVVVGSWKIPKHRATGRKTIYRATLPGRHFASFVEVESGLTPEMATVVRPGGTSDREFRQALGWANRGQAELPSDPAASSGEKMLERPDAKKLMQAGGLEVIEVAVKVHRKWKCTNGKVARLIRSPADVLYYSGHGSHAANALLAGNGAWLKAGDLTPHWKSPMDLDVFIIAGCSVLAINTGLGGTPGKEWAKLLVGRGGPLAALLGYAGSAPADSSGGDDIAKEVGGLIAGGSRDFVKMWLNANGKRSAWNAVGMDSQGYWYLEPHTMDQIARTLGLGSTVGYDIKGPNPI